MAAKLDNLPIRTALYHLAIVRGDAVMAEEQVRWSSGQGAQDNLGPTIAYAAAQRGRLRAARAIVEGDVKELRAGGFEEAAALEYSALALLEAASHNFKESHRHVLASLTLFRGRSNLAILALVLALAGDTHQSQVMMDELALHYRHDALLNRFLAPCARAAIAINRRQYDRAISLLEPVQRYDLGADVEFLSLYLRGLAHLGNRQAEAAAGEFEKIVNHRGIAPVSLNWALAQLGLARAYALSGNAGKARVAYQSFLALWKDADSDAPILQEAKAEYQQLK